MSQYFITNSEEKNLSKVIQGILPSKATSLDFLVGYFYFSGIEEIYNNIADKKMRILVGLEMDRELQNKTSEIDFAFKKKTSSRQEIRNEFNESLTYLFNKSDYFESSKRAEAFKIYYHKIKDGSLEIRKTLEPCHAKMYIFEYREEFAEDGETPGCVITGSSNLTYSGLRGQNEINVRFQNKAEYVEAEKIFADLWENAVVIADKEHIADFDNGVIKHIWYEKLPSPYLLYIKSLYEYFNIDTSKHIRTPYDITKGKFLNLKYQEDAVRMALTTIEKHNGVIVSDVVGLGKSIIASAVGNNLNLRTIIIAPPHLVPQWEEYRSEFNINAFVFSRGMIEKALDKYRMLTRGEEQWLIILDEAHNYRNEFTRDYALLHQLCQGNKVMLLTATPFNNQPSDIYSMVKLFQIPTKSTLQTVENLGESFRELISTYKQIKKSQKAKEISGDELQLAVESIAKRIRTIISPLVIRRSRLDLKGIDSYAKDLKLQNIEFAEVADPELLDYKLGNLRELYLTTLRQISPKDTDNNLTEDDFDYDSENDDVPEKKSEELVFQAARYKPVVYVKPEFEKELKEKIEATGLEYNLFRGTQKNLSKFMRTLLVRRFESSQHAFHKSLDNMIINCENILVWAEKRKSVPVFKKGQLPDIEDLYESTSDMIPEMVEDQIDAAIGKLEARGMFEIKTDWLFPSFFDDLYADIELLKSLQKQWQKVTEENDPKLKEFIKIISAKLKNEPNRKIVVFSQFADTVDYLGKKMKAAGLPVFSYTSANSSSGNKDIIRANFDAGLNEYKQQNVFQVLVATDAISEGYNLHRAGAIFNYDIPYNPTRVIQRVGRINRINKKMFSKLHIYNYFPTDIGEAETRTQEISMLKMAMIHAIMGEDTKILTSEEKLRSYFSDQYKKIIAADESESWDVKYRRQLEELKGLPVMTEALSLPLRCKVRRQTHLPEKGVLVFAKRGNDFVFRFGRSANEIVDTTPEEAFKLMETDIEEKPFEVSKQFEPIYDAIKNELFVSESAGDTEQTKRKALDKIRVIIQMKGCSIDYLEDLKMAVEHDAISGYALRQINRLKTADYSSLPDMISHEYLQKVLHTYDNISHGVETMIHAEEIDSDSVIPDTDDSKQLQLGF
jgi:superfamily II DNA or RNA helicase